MTTFEISNQQGCISIYVNGKLVVRMTVAEWSKAVRGTGPVTVED